MESLFKILMSGSTPIYLNIIGVGYDLGIGIFNYPQMAPHYVCKSLVFKVKETPMTVRNAM
jgi:hypothetical protein